MVQQHLDTAPDPLPGVMPGPGVRMPSADEDPDALDAVLRERLAATRAKTLDLIAGLPDEHLYEQPEATMGVIAWDAGHIGFFEHRWLVEALGGDPVDDETASLYDPFEHPRSERGQLDLPDRKRLRMYLSDVRERALTVLDDVDLAGDDRLTRDGFVHDMIVRHEDQHRENMLIALSLFGQTPDLADPPTPEPVPDAVTPVDPADKPAARATVDGMVEVPSGTVEIGIDPTVGTYDNEWPAHEVEIEPFRIDAAPVTNREYLAFIEDGGYQDPDHWSEDGWMIRQALDLAHPKHWRETEDDRWVTREFDRAMPLPLDQPVVHVSYYEAEAYASWAGKRLPSEAEWETAASLDPATGQRHRFPWGDAPWDEAKANLGQRTWGPAPVGAYPDGASPVGCHQMVGDVWEWTSSVFSGYPGFEAFPYDEYSKAHLDTGYQVLRGGSWATEPSCAHVTFRNWHQPDHQQLFAGFRCVEETSA